MSAKRMKVDAEISVESPADAASSARRAERCDFDAVWINETKHDPFVQLALAATATKKIMIGTSIALAFTRSPTTLAYAAWDIQNLSSGRLILGLGSQVKGHIERRFGIKWEQPVPKMRDVVLALRSVWQSWQTKGRLDYNGEFFKLDLMTPFFSPGPISTPRIPVYIAGVNRLMCRLAGEIAEGLHVHPLHTVRYLRDVVRPSLETGIQESRRARAEVEVAASVFAAVGNTAREIRETREAYREQVAFYASTRTYRKLMDLHGWGDVCDRLHDLSMRGEWRRMALEITDDMLNEFVVEGTWSELGAALESRYSGIVDRLRLYKPYDRNRGWKELVAGFKERC